MWVVVWRILPNLPVPKSDGESRRSTDFGRRLDRGPAIAEHFDAYLLTATIDVRLADGVKFVAFRVLRGRPVVFSTIRDVRGKVKTARLGLHGSRYTVRSVSKKLKENPSIFFKNNSLSIL